MPSLADVINSALPGYGSINDRMLDFFSRGFSRELYYGKETSVALGVLIPDTAISAATSIALGQQAFFVMGDNPVEVTLEGLLIISGAGTQAAGLKVAVNAAICAIDSGHTVLGQDIKRHHFVDTTSGVATVLKYKAEALFLPENYAKGTNMVFEARAFVSAGVANTWTRSTSVAPQNPLLMKAKELG